MIASLSAETDTRSTTVSCIMGPYWEQLKSVQRKMLQIERLGSEVRR